MKTKLFRISKDESNEATTKIHNQQACFSSTKKKNVKNCSSIYIYSIKGSKERREVNYKLF